MKTRLVMNLGMGGERIPHYYETVAYSFQGRSSGETALVERALLDLLVTDDELEVVVLGTRDVEARWVGSGLLQELLGRPFRFELVSDLGAEAPRDAFQKTAEALGAWEDAGRLPERILFDVTHGYRAQPILGMAAAVFCLSEWKRRRLERPPPMRVFYGAFEARKDRHGPGPAPIWELTQFVSALLWYSGLDALLRDGRADDLEALGATETRRFASAMASATPAQREEMSFPRRLGGAARAFADDLALGRVDSLFKRSARNLLETLESPAAATWRAKLPVLQGVDEVREILRQLCASQTLGPDGLRAMLALARHYGQVQRFAEQAAVVREALVTHFGLERGMPCPEPGTRGMDAARDAIDRAWGAAGRQAREGSEGLAAGPLAANVRLGAAVAQARNDVEHLGLNAQPSSSAKLRKTLQDLVESLAACLGERRPPASSAQASAVAAACFVNLSNHPVASWPPGQAEAAGGLGLGEAVDLPGGLPEVDPAWDTERVEALAREIAERATALGAAGAAVSGDYCLSAALVRELQTRGVRCFAPTTARSAVETARADGSVQSERVFRFVRWREYPATS